MTAFLSNLTITDGKITVPGAKGGGIYNAGTLSLTNTTVSNNSADDAIQERDSSSGGGLFNASGSFLTLTNSKVNNNSAGPIVNVVGGGFNSNGYGGGIYNQVTMTLINSIISNNRANGSQGFTTAGNAAGGGIYGNEFDITGSTISGNTSSAAKSFGGGIYGNGNIISSAIINNTASSGGGEFERYKKKRPVKAASEV